MPPELAGGTHGSQEYQRPRKPQYPKELKNIIS